jgi:hypothetical protein|tara:strand:- start:212 stop:430 length:219 start_codon:yes stop_codon:yes gene_type:complete
MLLSDKKKITSIAGIMGGSAAQPAQMMGQMTVDPLERAQQKMAGRTQGGALEGIRDPKLRPKRTIMNSYGMS